LMYLRTSSLITNLITTDVSVKTLSSTVPILIPEKRTLLPHRVRFELNLAVNSNVEPNKFFCFPTKYIVVTKVPTQYYKHS
jgi:hypothetical protein